MKNQHDNYFPLFFNAGGKQALVVGGGAVALRRCRLLAEAGFALKVVSPELSAELVTLLQSGGHLVEQKRYEARDIDSPFLVVAATNDAQVNLQVADDCSSRGIPVNVASQPEAGDFIFSSVVERGPLKIAISAGGHSPVLTRLLKNLVQGLVPASYGELAALVGHYREQVRQCYPDEKQRVVFWEAMLQGAVAEAVFSGKTAEAEALLSSAIANPETALSMGEVYLIGAGPGDPGLLTLRAFRLIQQADVVLYDRLVSDEIMALVKPDAEKIYVGKRRADHAVPQPDINRLLVEHAKKGRRVARLKGGDPFIFGRGGEEIAELAAECIPFQVIPGISAANGCAAYAGIPLTHRDHAQSVRFVTGQLKDGGVDLDWSQLVKPGQTLVFYMGLNGLPEICRQMMAHGADPALPAALIEKGTTVDQRVHVSTLGDMISSLDREQVKSPTLLIVGSVVSLHESLRWFEPQSGSRPEKEETMS